MKRIASLVTLALVAATVPGTSSAQTPAPTTAPTIELGIDAGVATTLGGDYHITTVSIPTSSVRAGFYVNDRVSFEPVLSLNSTSGGGDRVTTYDAAIGVLLHGRGERVGAGVYVRPFAGISGFSTDGSSETQTYLGGGLGVAIPFAQRMATRLELAYEHGFKTNFIDGNNVLAATIGISFFNH